MYRRYPREGDQEGLVIYDDLPDYEGMEIARKKQLEKESKAIEEMFKRSRNNMMYLRKNLDTKETKNEIQNKA